MIKTTTDEYGRVKIDTDALIEALYAGASTQDVLVTHNEELEQYNTLCERFGKYEHMIGDANITMKNSPEEEHLRRTSSWNIPDEYLKINLEEYLSEKCNTCEEADRVAEELILFKERGLIPVLLTMIFLVDTWRENNVVWGVGRGSSVCSFVLYLIGINRINPMKYNLSIQDFLR